MALSFRPLPLVLPTVLAVVVLTGTLASAGATPSPAATILVEAESFADRGRAANCGSPAPSSVTPPAMPRSAISPGRRR
jgi:hypothetical protein